MLRIWCIFFSCGWLATSQRTDAPGAILKLDLGTIDRAVSDAMTESNILQKLAAAATKKQPGVKPIKGISGVKVKDLQPPEITLTFLPGTGLFMAVLTRITITGKSFIGENMEITVAANMTAKNKLLQADSGCPRFSAGDCQISLVSIKTDLPSSMLPKLVNKFVNTTLQKVLPDMLCPAVDAVLTLVNQKFTTLVSPSSVGTAGSICYALLSPPVTSEVFIELDLKTMVLQEGGNLIDLPADPPALTSLPPKMDSATQLALSVNFLSAELTLMQTSLNLDVTETIIHGLPPLMKTTLGTLIPTLSESLSPSQPMVIEIQITKPPVLTMRQDKGLVHLFGTAEFLTSQPNAARESLFVLNIHINLDTQFSIQEEKLRISLALDSLYGMALAASSIGMFAELPVKGFLVNIIEAAYVPAINGALQEGIPLPHLLGIKYANADISMSEKVFLAVSGCRVQDCEELKSARQEDTEQMLQHNFASALQPLPVLNLP